MKKRTGNAEEDDKLKPTLTKEFIESTFLFALVWSVGATIDLEGHDLFNIFLRSFIQNPNVVETNPEYKGKVFKKKWYCCYPVKRLSKG